MQNLYQSAIGNEVTLWWDLPKDAAKDTLYTVEMNGTDVLETDRTHARVTLREKACLAVRMNGEVIARADAEPGLERKRLNVRDFGAAGDGKTLDTAALQRAMDACGPLEEVFFPAGEYLTGALDLHSHMALHLEKGAVLQGTRDPRDYLPKIPSRFEGYEMECYRGLLNLGQMDHHQPPEAEDVLIYGEGIISGGGQDLGLAIIECEKERLKAYLEELGEGIREYENDHTIPGRARGRLINLSNCKNVRITGLTLQNGACWNVHMLYSAHIVTDHCVFRSEGVWNGDGWDPDSSEDCTLFACSFYTGDDSVAIKSGKNPEGNLINRPTRNIRVFDCVSHEGLGIAVGSEMSGGVEEVHIWHCDLEHSLYGVQIKGTRKRGGFVRRVSVRDSVLSRFEICAVRYNDDGEGSRVPPEFGDMLLERVHLTGWARNYWEKEDRRIEIIDLAGFDGSPAHDIVVRDCTAGEDAHVRMDKCRNVSLDIRRAD